MYTNATLKYFKQFREAHNMDNSDYVTNGEVLVWLTDKLEHEAEARSPKVIAAKHQEILDRLEKYYQENPEVKALATKFGPSNEELAQRRRSNIGVHQTHCCKGHGCKYNDADCPVVLGEIEGLSACEFDKPDSTCSGEPTVSQLNTDRIKAYNNFASTYNVNESIIRDSFNAGIDWCITQIKK